MINLMKYLHRCEMDIYQKNIINVGNEIYNRDKYELLGDRCEKKKNSKGDNERRYKNIKNDFR